MAEQAYAEPKQSETAFAERAQLEEPKGGDTPRAKRWLALAIGLLFCLVTYLLHLDRSIGMYVDDAWYVLLAKALATGQGYTLANSPSPGILPLYPPAFPWLLSLVYRFGPQFPENVWLLKSVSIAAMIGVGIVAYHYFVRDRELPPSVALGTAVATVISPPLIFFATSTAMSECVFTFVQLLTVVVIERCVRPGKKGRIWHYALLGSALASFAFLTRSIAVMLLVAAFVYLLKERLLRAALIFAAGTILFAGPWTIYARMHAPTAEQRMEQGGHIALSYTTQFWQREAGDASSGTVSVKEIPARIWNNALQIVNTDLGAMTATQLIRSIRYRSPLGAKGISVILSALAVAGFISAARKRITLAELVVPLSLLIVVLWPWRPSRLILPLAPFLIFYVLMGVGVVHQLYQRVRQTSNPRARWVVATVVVWCIVASNTVANVKYIRLLHGPPAQRPMWVRTFEENEKMFKWIRATLPKEDAIATLNPALVNLYTGHKTVFAIDPAGNWENWKRLGVRYLVYTSWHRAPDFEPAEGKYDIVYYSGDEMNLRVVDLGPKSLRLPWEAAPEEDTEKEAAVKLLER